MTTKRNGFTLIEIMVVVSIIGVMMIVSAPRISKIKDRTNLRAARDEIVSGLATARSAAVQKGVTATFYMRGDTVQVKLGTVAAEGQQILPARPLSDLYDAHVVSADASDVTIAYDTRGFAQRSITTQATYRVTVGSLTDSVCVSKLGLVSKTGCIN